mgnify:CR=1 FL=1
MYQFVACNGLPLQIMEKYIRKKIQNHVGAIRFKVLESKDESIGLGEKDVKTDWETIRYCIKQSAAESIGYLEKRKYKK